VLAGEVFCELLLANSVVPSTGASGLPQPFRVDVDHGPDYAAWATVTLGLVTLILGVAGFFVALRQYKTGLKQHRTAQTWKRSEFAAKLLEKMSSDWRLVLCGRLLDWQRRPMPIPRHYRPAIGRKVFRHEWCALADAMRGTCEADPDDDDEALQHGTAGRAEPRPPAAVTPNEYSWRQVIYRDVFGTFFDYLARIDHYISIGLITQNDVKELEYWLKAIADPPFEVNSVEASPFAQFVDQFGYEGVGRLLEKFQITWKRALQPSPSGGETASS
jgi:hypothetical protein